MDNPNFDSPHFDSNPMYNNQYDPDGYDQHDYDMGDYDHNGTDYGGSQVIFDSKLCFLFFSLMIYTSCYCIRNRARIRTVSYTHLRAHETLR